MKRKIDYELIAKLTEKLKLSILNEPEMEVRIAVEKLRELVKRPEYWASDWSEKR